MRVEQSIECSSYEEALEWIEEHNDTSASVEYDGERVFVRHYENCSSQTSDVEEKWLADREKAEKRYVVYTLYGGKSYMYLKRGKGVTFNLSEAGMFDYETAHKKAYWLGKGGDQNREWLVCKI